MVDVCSYLSALLASFYTIWYFISHKLYAGIDFMMILIIVAFLFMHLYLKPLSKELYYAVWVSASFITYMMFLSFCLIVLSVINLIYEAFPSTKVILMQLWDGGDSNEKWHIIPSNLLYLSHHSIKPCYLQNSIPILQTMPFTTI